MKKTLILLTLLASTVSVKAQTKPKECATADPKKIYEFKLSIPAETINKLANLLQLGANAANHSETQAKIVTDQIETSAAIIQDLNRQLRTQIVLDSIKSVKK